MNDPDTFTVDVEEMRLWLQAHKETSGLSWPQLQNASGIPSGTLGPFMSGSYPGDKQAVAKRVYRYKQLVDSQAAHAVGLPEAPGFVETETSRRIRALLITAHRGRMTMAATGPGTSKTLTARNYAASVPNVWIATMQPVTKTLNAMVGEVQRAVGGTSQRGWSRVLSEEVATAVIGKSGLLVIDEANHLDFEALEQLRSWHDTTGVGVCLLGNEELYQRIRGGVASHAFARLNSRIAASHVQDLPTEGDIHDILDAWRIGDPAQRRLLTSIGSTAGYGGLREITMIIENAALLASHEGRGLSLDDLKDAQSMRASKSIRVAA